MSIKRFEDLIAWQKARILNADVYRLTRGVAFRQDRGMVYQMRSASNSIMANIAEGFERNRPKEFHQFLSTAKASCAELRSHLYSGLDTGLIKQSEFASNMANSQEVARLIGGLRAAIERKHLTRRKSHSALSTQHSALP